MDVGRTAEQIAAITVAEENLCYRSPAELEKAIREDRWYRVREDGSLVGFLFEWPYGDWVELGTGYVVPGHRGQGVYTRLHERATDDLDDDGRSAFEFPGNGAVERVLEKTGFVQSPYTELPLGVWTTFLAERRTPDKLRSYLDMLGRDEPLYSLRLYTYTPNGARPDGRPRVLSIGRED